MPDNRSPAIKPGDVVILPGTGTVSICRVVSLLPGPWFRVQLLWSTLVGSLKKGTPIVFVVERDLARKLLSQEIALLSLKYPT